MKDAIPEYYTCTCQYCGYYDVVRTPHKFRCYRCGETKNITVKEKYRYHIDTYAKYTPKVGKIDTYVGCPPFLSDIKYQDKDDERDYYWLEEMNNMMD